MQKAYIQYGSSTNLPMQTIQAEDVIKAPLWFHTRNLMQTSTGYGSKISTQYKIKHNNKLYRVYCSIFSNNGRLYIISQGNKLTVNIDSEA